MIGSWPGPAGEEYALVFDRQRERRLLVLPALFDEANKLRHLTVETVRLLDAMGVDCFLPDLPGCNESLAPLAEQDLESWRSAAAAACDHFRATHVLGIRCGALMMPDDRACIAYAPAKGSGLLNTMLRARVITSREAGLNETRDGLLAQGRKEGLRLSGHSLSAQMVSQLEAAEPREDARAITQSELGGAGLWFRAEPEHDPAQAEALAAIVAAEIGA